MKIEWEDDEDNKRDSKRQELVEFAAQLFSQKGFKNTKLEDIASVSQKGKTALYYYFRNKKSIFAAAVDWEITRIYQSIEDATLAGAELSNFLNRTSDGFDSQAALGRYVKKVVEIGDTFLRRNNKILVEYASFQKLIQSIVRSFKEQNVLLLQAILHYGVYHAQLNLTKDNIDLAAYGIFRICFTYYSDIMQGLNFQVGSAELNKIVHLIAGISPNNLLDR